MNLEQVEAMLNQAFSEDHYTNTILHSDQGWQYQHQYYHRFLEDKGIQPSMSRKGNSPDNGMMESFFGILKSEMFYGYENTFKSLNQLEQAIVNLSLIHISEACFDLVWRLSDLLHTGSSYFTSFDYLFLQRCEFTLAVSKCLLHQWHSRRCGSSLSFR